MKIQTTTFRLLLGAALCLAPAAVIAQQAAQPVAQPASSLVQGPTLPSNLPAPAATQPLPQLPPGDPNDGQRPSPGPAEPRDPTQVDPNLRPILDPPTRAEGANNQVIILELKGRIVNSAGKSLGVLRVDDKMSLIREGSKVRHKGSTIIVKAFKASEVTLEIEETSEVIDLR